MRGMQTKVTERNEHSVDRMKRIVSAIIDSVSHWRKMLDEWDTFDDSLQEHYATEAEWLLHAARDHLDNHAGTPEEAELRQQADAAVMRLEAELGDEIKRTMGFRPLEIWSEK